jgi:chorismate mutase
MKKEPRSDFTKRLKKNREALDFLDRRLLTLLNQRLRITQGIGKIKEGIGKRIYDPEREKEILERLQRKNKGPLNEKDLRKIFGMIMNVCRRSQI